MRRLRNPFSRSDSMAVRREELLSRLTEGEEEAFNELVHSLAPAESEGTAKKRRRKTTKVAAKPRRTKKAQPAKRVRSKRAPSKKAVRRRPPSRGRQALAAGVAAFGLLAVVAGGSVLWSSGWIDRQAIQLATAAEQSSLDLGFAVTEVFAEGRVRTDREALLTAVGVERGSSMLTFSPAAARDRLEALPWVRRAAVERHLPDTVYVRIEERSPLALWQLDGTLRVIDQDGQPITQAGLGEFSHLPILVGEDAPKHARELIALLASEPDLNDRVTAAVRVSGRRWSVRLDDIVDVYLPSENPASAWTKLARLNRRHAVFGRDVIVIDMRLPDRMVVRLAPDAVASMEPGKDT